MEENNKSEPDKEVSFPTASLHDSFAVIGDHIGPYTLLSVLGEGGFAIVYLAEQRQPIKRQVALKMLKPGMDSRQVIARFEAERQALALLDHPNIAHVYDAGSTESGRPYFVMEYIKGIPITEFCDYHHLKIKERLKLFIQVCEAIGHAHQKGIIHRDVKPSNIVVSFQDGKGVPRVIDFGIAKAIGIPLTEKTLYTQQGQLIGTPEYMSPEQADLREKDIDTRTDIYSLGVVLYELLSGVLPFEPREFREAGDAAIRQIIREQEPPRPSTRLSSLGKEDARKVAQNRHTDVSILVKRLHKELEWIPLKAIRKELEYRYKTASDMAEDVQNYLDGNPLTAGPESKLYRGIKYLKKHFRFIAACIAIVIGLFVGMLMSVIIVMDRAHKEAEAVSLCSEVWEIINSDSDKRIYTIALSKAQNLDQLEPDTFFIKIMLADIHYQLDNYHDAFNIFTSAFEQNQNDYDKIYSLKIRRKALPDVKKEEFLAFIGRTTSNFVELKLKKDNPDFKGQLNCLFKHGQIAALYLSNSPVRNISALKYCKLDVLDLSNTQVDDISVLSGQRLVCLDLGKTAVKELDVLKNMPLEYLVVPDEGLRASAESLLPECLVFTHDNKPTLAMSLSHERIYTNNGKRYVAGLNNMGERFGSETEEDNAIGLNFNGQDNYILIHNNFVKNQPNWTWSGWIYLNGSGKFECFYNEGKHPNLIIRLWTKYGSPADTFDIGLWGQSGFKYCGPAPGLLPQKSWNLVTITLQNGGDQNGQLTAYVNGRQVKKSYDTTIANGGGETLIGAIFANYSRDSLFKGRISEVQIYNRVLSLKEIIKLNYIGAEKHSLKGLPSYDILKNSEAFSVFNTMATGNFEEALKQAEQLNLLSGQNKKISSEEETRFIMNELAGRFYTRGEAWEQLEDYKSAVADYASALRINPAHQKALNKIACIQGLLALAENPHMIPSQVQVFGKNRYLLYSKAMTWPEAKMFSESVGGHLATISTKEENDWINKTISSDDVNYWLGGFQNLNSPTFSEPSGGWEWVTGEKWRFSNWMEGEPNNDREQHALQVFVRGRWDDDNMAVKKSFLIEWDR